MFSTASIRRAGAVFAVALLATSACRSSTESENDEPEVAAIRVTVGTSVVTVNEGGAVSGGPLRLSTTAQPLTVAFLKADGSNESRVTSDEFRLDVTGGTGITFTRSGAFAGTLRGASAGNSTIQISLFHLIENHADFGPFTVQVQVQ